MGSPWDSDYTTGLPEPSARFTSPRDLASNALWNLGGRAVNSFYEGLVKPVGQVFTGELTPSMTPGPNQLAVPEYALGLAGGALGFRGLGFSAPEGALTTFPVYHGTGARQPFHHFDDEFMGTGEGTQYEGWGHYVAEREGIAKSYKNISGSDVKVPVDEAGLPLSQGEILKKYFEPGSIIPSYGGTYDRVLKLNDEDFAKTGNWSVDVRQVGLDRNKQQEALKSGTPFHPDFNYPLKYPEFWTDTGPVRNHATFPTDYSVEQVAGAKGWDLGDRGGLLHINVKPEKNEFLDLNLPWRNQDPIVRERLEKAFLAPQHVDPMHYDIREDTHIPAGQLGAEHEYMTGRDLYNSLVNSKKYELYRNSDPDIYRAMMPDDFVEPAKEAVSKEIDAAGVPGFKFLDRPSRQIGPTLEHEGNFNDMPGIFSVDHILRENMSPKTFNVEDMVAHKRNLLGNEAFKAESRGDWKRAQTLYQGQDWLTKELEAGRFSLGDAGRTRNFVVVNPANLEIRTWNGRQLTPVPHNPHSNPVSLTPVEHDPFAMDPTPDPGFPANFPQGGKP